MTKSNLNEGLYQNDLARLIRDEIHIDEYKSKIGKDEDVVTVTFKVTDRAPANDLVSFIEKGFDFVLDAEVSAGEKSDGDYLVFVEIERKKGADQNIVEMCKQVSNLADIDQWYYRYYKNNDKKSLTTDNLAQDLPLTPTQYKASNSNKEQDTDTALENMQMAAKVPMKKPVVKKTNFLQRLAGIK